MSDTTLKDVFGKEGLLANKFEGYEPRPSQVEMAKLIKETIADKGIAVVEGETGVGKSFGYLVPILLSGKQAIVSTSNKALQDQLNTKDLPSLREILPFEIDWVVLKGRSNYFCTEHFNGAEKELRALGMTDYDLQKMAEWAHDNEHHSDLDFYPEKLDPKIRELIACDRDASHDKDSKQICYANEARVKAREANIVLTNHSLMAIDLSLRLKSENKAGVLPEHPVVVLDEAHAFEQYASLAFSVDVSMRTLYHLLDWYEVGQVTKQNERAHLISVFKTTLNKYLPEKSGRGYYQATRHDRFEGFEYVIEFLSKLRGRLGGVDIDGLDERSRNRLQRIKKECDNLREKLIGLGEIDEDVLKWVEARDYGGKAQIYLKSVPLDISGLLSQVLYPSRTVVATSATITTGNSFTFFIEQMGMPERTKTLIAESPFDFQNNALGFITDGSEDKVKELEQLLEYSQGRAFVLFTSYKEMRNMYDWVNTPHPKMIQEGRINRRELLEEFKATPNAVLFATKSFWEGVDVQGEELSLVVIDKLPFANPYEPLTKAKFDRIEKQQGKGSGFFHYSIPQACISFKQGVGRLIRSKKDRGVIAILDPRLNHASYRKAFIDSLPRGMYITQKMPAIKRFFEKSA